MTNKLRLRLFDHERYCSPILDSKIQTEAKVKTSRNFYSIILVLDHAFLCSLGLYINTCT